MSSQSRGDESLNRVLHVLTELGITPKIVPNGTISHLRGAYNCIDLMGTKDIDSVLLLSKLNRSFDFRSDPRYLHRLDYAVRGNIKGILPGRMITQTAFDVKGLFKKKISDIKWILLAERRSEAYASPSTIEGILPKPGEIWSDGPHQMLVDQLNNNRDLHQKLLKYCQEKEVPQIQFTLFSDRWGESLRLAGNIWLNPKKLTDLYASRRYLEIISIIFLHLKNIRKIFGGLTF